MIKNISLNTKMQLVLIFGLIAGLVSSVIYQHHQYYSTMNPGSFEVIRLDVDHKRYSNISSLRRDADIIVRGTILNNGDIIQGDSAMAADGRIIPAIPQTNFIINVDKILKGKVTVNQIVVCLTGGTIGSLDYRVVDMPWLTKGQRAIFFLKDGGNGKYYPLAGGAGIGKQSKDSKSYELPKAVSDNNLINVTESTVEGQ